MLIVFLTGYPLSRRRELCFLGRPGRVSNAFKYGYGKRAGSLCRKYFAHKYIYIYIYFWFGELIAMSVGFGRQPFFRQLPIGRRRLDSMVCMLPWSFIQSSNIAWDWSLYFFFQEHCWSNLSHKSQQSTSMFLVKCSFF